jgi:hypothetical protein
MAEVSAFYRKLLPRFRHFSAEPDVFVDGGDIVTALGFYSFTVNEWDTVKLIRFSHTWKIAPDGRIEGVWQVADSAAIREHLAAV